MSRVIIASKTRMKNGICVGAIDQSTGEFIRLHNERGGNLPLDVPYEIGDIWDMAIGPAWNARPIPHTEDRQTTPLAKLGNIGVEGIMEFIASHDLGPRLTRGPLHGAFSGCLKIEGSRAYVDHERTPEFSTQIWIADRDLIRYAPNNKEYYIYNRCVRIRYVGLQAPVDIISANSVVRLSLAHWWDGDGSGEERCYLQLSGWYA